MNGSLVEVREQLEAITRDMLDTERRFLAGRSDIPKARRASAANLLHYVAGLSSLGRAESHVLATQIASPSDLRA